MKPRPFSLAKHLPVLFLLIFLSFFAHLGNMPLFDANEGAYSEVTREMLQNQNFTSVLLNGMPFPHRPPLFYWAQAASIKILGLNEFGLRLPSAIAALLWTLSIFLFTRRYYDTGTAWHGALFMCSSLLVTIVGRNASPEALLNLFLTLTLLNIYRYYQGGNKRHIYWSFMFAALGVLTKGGLAILLPLAVTLTFFSCKRKWRGLMQLLGNPVGLMVFGLIVIPWYLGEFMLHGEAFLSDLLMLPGMESYQIDFVGLSLPYYAYPACILIGLLPFSGLALKAFFHVRKQLSDDLMKFLLTWFLLALCLLPVAQPRTVFAIAYCFPPLCIIMARAVPVFRHAFNLFAWPLLFITLLLLVPYLAPYFAGTTENELVQNVLEAGMEYLDLSYQLSLAGVLLLLALLPFIKGLSNPVKFGILGLLFVSLVNFLVMPIIAGILQQPIKSAGLLAKKEKLEVITWGIQSPSFNVYAEKLTAARAPRAGDIVLTKSANLKNDFKYELLFEKQGVVLVKFLEISKGKAAGSKGNK